MLQTPRWLRPILVAIAAAMLLAHLPARAAPPAAQPGRYAAEIAKVEASEMRVTLKGSMGQLSVRVAPDVALDALKPGDKVLISFGQATAEAVITSIEVVKP